MSASTDDDIDVYDLEQDDDDNESASTDEHSTDNSTSKQTELAEDETKRVERFRIILVVVLSVVGAALCAGTFLFVKHETDKDYQLSVSTAASC